MLPITLAIITKNEENNILDCLTFAQVFEEIIVVDDNSDDRTLEIIKKLNPKIKVFSRSLKNDFSAQRNFALSKSTKKWVLFLDADERIGNNLIEEINEEIEKGVYDAFYIKRTDKFMGSELKYGETGNIKLIRIAKRGAGEWKGKVHEIWDIKGRIGELKNELIHLPHPTVSDFLTEINKYSTIRADELFNEKRKVSFIDIITYPSAKFVLNYFIKKGFNDQIPGLIMALTMSFHSFLVRGKLWQKNLQNKKSK